MNVALMTEYFKKIYSDPIASATVDDPEYKRRLGEFRKEEGVLQRVLDEHDTALYRKHEKTLDYYFSVEERLLLDVYLMGARDRERMLE
ncbi:MAG: hypothetical protein LUE24_15465 [Lachnospiraceae bacterium]|nr:hypothetical protein [Lachnospiraceae bacterium]